MNTDTAVAVPKLFMPHPNFSDEVNRNIVQSEIEGGVYLDNLPDGEVLEVETQNRGYTIVVRRGGKDLIWGHPQYCPEPVAVRTRATVRRSERRWCRDEAANGTTPARGAAAQFR